MNPMRIYTKAGRMSYLEFTFPDGPWADARDFICLSVDMSQLKAEQPEGAPV